MQQSTNQQSSSNQSLKNVSTTKTPQTYINHTLGYRHEIKYLISESKAKAIERYIKPYLRTDTYCKLQRGCAYPIVSLYLDSDTFQLARENLTGKKNRFKLRVRSYTDKLDYPRFFEIKRRINTIIVKSRVRVPHQHIPMLLRGLLLPPQEYNVDVEVLDQFQLYMKSINAKPLILVRYMRQAFEDDSHYRVRVTFDRQLCYKVTRKPEVALGGSGWQHGSLPLGGVILEVKFTARYPAWLSRMVGYFNLQQSSMSKYAASITQSCLLGFCTPHLGEDGIYG